MRILRFLNACLILGFLPLWAWGQTYSEEEISVEGIQFSRFALVLKPSERFQSQSENGAWREILERNLCWSGVFLLTNSQGKFCPSPNQHTDMQLKIDVTDAGERQLQLVVSDKDGVALFDRTVPLAQNRLNEDEVINAVNQITEKLTGEPGILGSTIAFAFKQPGRKKVIARVDTHGRKLAAVSFNQDINLAPNWNYQGNAIVYTSVNNHGTSIVYHDLTGKVSKLANFLGVNSGGSWSADGSRLIVTLSKDGNADLYEISVKDRAPRRLTTHPAIDTAPALSPDGQYLLFVSDRGGTEQIHMMYMPNGEVYRLTFTGVRNTDPKWSPDGKLIAFTKTVNGKDQIYVMDVFGENVRPVTRGPFHAEQPAWAPDGKQLVFASNRNGNYKLYVIFIDGTGLRRLTNTPNGFEESAPSWTRRRF